MVDFMSNTLQIMSVLGKKFALSQEDAEKVFPSLDNAVKNECSLFLSFEGLENCSSIFLKNLLGKLYFSYGEKVDRFIQFTGIDNDDLVLPNQLERLRLRALKPEVYKPIFNSAVA
jgi:hypothetical protein